MEKRDVIVVGGGPAGVVAALTGKSCYPEKEFLLIRKNETGVVPCGIPYIFRTLGDVSKDILPYKPLEKVGIDTYIGEVVKIDQENKVCILKDGTEFKFEKLIIATGSVPKVPGWLKGVEYENVFVVPKDYEYLKRMMEVIKESNRIVVVGGGFIGVEISDELASMGKDVTLVEILPHILCLVFDANICEMAEKMLREKGVKIKTGSGIKEIVGRGGKVAGVRLQNGEFIEAEVVILSLGYEPNTTLARNSGIPLNEMGYIKVDDYMRTENPSIFAVGDCAEKKDFITKRPSNVMLASTACTQARIAGMNLYKLSTVRTFSGTIAIFSTVINGVGFGAAGLTESLAQKEGFDIVTGEFEGMDRHPGTIPGTSKQYVKLIAARESGVVIGGEVVGGQSTGELVNLIGFVIQNRMSISDIMTAQIGTHPLLTAPPTA